MTLCEVFSAIMNRVRRLDARSLRAVAHPLRLRLLSMVNADGPATATQLAARVGETSGTTSWHLRQLAEHGFIEEDAERGNRRERWWRSAQDALEFREEDFAGVRNADPDIVGAMEVYLHEVLAMDYHRATAFLAEAVRWDVAWLRSVNLSNARLCLTPDELRALNDDIRAVIDRHRRPERPGDEMVVVQWQSFPRRRHSPVEDAR